MSTIGFSSLSGIDAEGQEIMAANGIIVGTGSRDRGGGIRMADTTAAIWAYDYFQHHDIPIPPQDFMVKALKYISCTLHRNNLSKMKRRVNIDFHINTTSIERKDDMVEAILDEMVKTYTVPPRYDGVASFTVLPQI